MIQELLKKDPIVILDGAKRTARADILHNNKEKGLLSDFSCNQLGGIAIKAAVDNSKIAVDEIGHVVMGNALESHRDSIYGARGMALEAKLPHDVPALTVRRICGSGAQAIVNGTHLLLLQDHEPNKDFIVVGGAESMQYPHVLYNLRGRKAGNTVVKYGALDVAQLGKGYVAQDLLHMALFDPSAGMAMANTAEKLGRIYNITRNEADQFAYQSHIKAKINKQNGHLKDEIVPIEIRKANQFDTMILDFDTHLREDIREDALADLPPVFEPPHGIITPGNASAVVDGASALILCRASVAEKKAKNVLARILGWGIAGVDPSIMGIGPVPATEKALAMAGIQGKDLDTVELNEAFAPQAIACIREFAKMGIDPQKVNPIGNAIALGHPLGATGAILTVSSAYYLKRTKGRYGLITMCIGGGQGIALIIERV